ncbi:hypothetical protein GZ77_03020 [Endozoicomonas montiporae]|uniref:Uncharacterized protein n=2 Tax=Endozoicomonas montiporae TaxID=1027273 RepID=A0A081NAX2_9GAMM|nr:hypothetical protein [Endozoicomonas montiporae]AMO56704.1 hypothetical protein EZMO1_2641 [Endozoicomonas montiporae CL-33]KEQ15595.1 hypothetical protein GZ77_03020 [Endozoicomonas montiporae]
MKKLLLISLLALPVGVIAKTAKDETMQTGSKPLINSSIQYGMMASAYLSSPVGMVVEGYRYQLRSLYLAYLEKKIQEPGNTVSTINEQLLSDWMMRLGREKVAPDVLVNVKADLEEKIRDWSDKRMSGRLNDFGSSEKALQTIKERIAACGASVRLSSSNQEKRQACHGIEQVTRNINEVPESADELSVKMQKLIYPYIDHLAQLKQLEYYQAFQDARKTFKQMVSTMIEQGYSAQQLAELLDFAGVDYPIVYDNLFVFALRNREGDADSPAEVVVH